MFVGTAGGRKRGKLLLEMFARTIRPQFSNASLVFVGPAGEPAPGVTYHTGISDQQLAALYRSAWLYVSPSVYEGFGLPYLEAMACGTAVVATPNPGSCEVLGHGEYGALVNDVGFESAVVELLKDAPRRRALEAAGLQRARQLSVDSMIDRYESILSQLSGAHVVVSA